MLIILLFVYLKHHYFVQLSHLYLTEILFALQTYPGLSALIFGLTQFSFKKKNMMKQQESSPFTPVGKSFEKNYILHGYYICVHHEGTICKSLSLFLYLYADFVIE